MPEELERIEKMLADGKISPEEAERLKKAVSDAERKEVATPPRPVKRVERPRLSKMAVAGALALPAAAALAAVVGLVGTSLADSAKGREAAGAAAGAAFLVVLLTGFVLSSVGLAGIRREPDRLRGRGLAVWGLLSVAVVPLLAVGYLALRSAARAGGRPSRGPLVLTTGEAITKAARAESAKALAEWGKTEVKRYLDFKNDPVSQATPWEPTRIDAAAYGADVVQALVLHGDTLIASSAENPQGIRGTQVPWDDRRVQVLEGRFTVRSGARTETLRCLQFKVLFGVEGVAAPCTARLIVSLE
jgi:hypothetical protein